MVSITGYGANQSSLAQLLNIAASASTLSSSGVAALNALTTPGQDESSVILNLSERAKAIMAKASAAQAPGGPRPATNLPLTGQDIDNPNYQLEHQAAHRQADGTFQSWSKSGSDLFNVPSTPQQINQWYQTQGQQMLQIAQALPDSFPGLAQAIQNKALTFTDARDIPGLNFHNTVTYEGGESGSGGSWATSFNSSLPMFQDPNTHYQIMGDGTVLSWPASPTQKATT